MVEQSKFIASFFFVPVVLGLNWRRGTREGAIWSMVVGFLACLIWTFTLQHSFAPHGIDSVEVGVRAERARLHRRQPADAAHAGDQPRDILRRAGNGPRFQATCRTRDVTGMACSGTRTVVRETVETMSNVMNMFKDEALETAARDAVRLDESKALLERFVTLIRESGTAGRGSRRRATSSNG